MNMYEDRPLCVGRLRTRPSGAHTLSSALGDVRRLSQREFDIVSRMDGFHTVGEVAAATGATRREVRRVFSALEGPRTLQWASRWNKLRFCPRCRLYLQAAGACPACGQKTAPVPLSPPYDPWIMFDEERDFVRALLERQGGLALPPDALLLGNNGIHDNVPFWEIVYCGAVIATVRFTDPAESGWRAELAPGARHARRQAPHERTPVVPALIAANSRYLDELTLEACAFLEEMAGLFATTPLIYFSGGKESVVMFDLFRRTGLAANLLFVAPGLDFPDDVAFTLQLKNWVENEPRFKLHTYVQEPQVFLDTARQRGELNIRDPWCRELFKHPLKKRATDELYGTDEFVACEGSRWYENDFRRTSPRVDFGRGYLHQVWIHPIAAWSGLDLWLHIFREKLPINPLYYKGFQRTTCWFCPIVNPFHLRCSQKHYPELWRALEGFRLIGFGDTDIRGLPF